MLVAQHFAERAPVLVPGDKTLFPGSETKSPLGRKNVNNKKKCCEVVSRSQ